MITRPELKEKVNNIVNNLSKEEADKLDGRLDLLSCMIDNIIKNADIDGYFKNNPEYIHHLRIYLFKCFGKAMGEKFGQKWHINYGRMGDFYFI